MGVASFSVGKYHLSLSMFSLNYRRIITPEDQLAKPFIQQLENDDLQQPPPIFFPTTSRVALGPETQYNTTTL